jgi:hypothetical protein
MRRTTKYVALDVHQATTVASVREEGGRVIARPVLPTEAPAIVAFFRGMRGAVHVTCEEGTPAQWLHELVAPLFDRVVVCDQRGQLRHGNKGDQVDADQLADLLRRGALRAVYYGSADRAVLKELARTYRTVLEDATRVMVRLKARSAPTRSRPPARPGITRAAGCSGSRSCRSGAPGSGPKSSTPSSTCCCGRCGPRRRPRWSPGCFESRAGVSGEEGVEGPGGVVCGSGGFPAHARGPRPAVVTGSDLPRRGMARCGCYPPQIAQRASAVPRLVQEALRPGARGGKRRRGIEPRVRDLPRAHRTRLAPAPGKAQLPQATAQHHGRAAALRREELQGIMAL